MEQARNLLLVSIYESSDLPSFPTLAKPRLSCQDTKTTRNIFSLPLFLH